MPEITTCPLLSPLYFRAQSFATEAHNYQLRKDGITPYVAHLLEVVSRLMKEGADETALICGWLHDVVEDTHVTLPDIRDRFGDEIAAIVAALSEGDYPPGTPKPSKRDRKQTYIDQVTNAPSSILYNVRLVSCTDKLCNGLDYLVEDARGNPQSPENAGLNLWLYRKLMPFYRESLQQTQLLLVMERVFGALNAIWNY